MSSVNRIVGCIIGGAIGDGLGSPYEGRTPPIEIELDRCTAWRLTDDTQLTLATCEALIAARGVDPNRIAARMADWFRDGRITGMGSSTLKALSELAHGAHWALSGRKGEMAAGNGAAARSAPLAFWLDPMDDASRQLFRDVVRITHHSDEAYAAALAVAAAVRMAWLGQWQGGYGLIAMVRPMLPDTRVRDRLMELERIDRRRSICDVAKEYGCSGFAAESVPLALFGAQEVAAKGLIDTLCELVAAGGDTDTIASIAGQISGTALGLTSLPRQWIERVAGSRELFAIAEQFAECVNHRVRDVP